MKTSIIIRVFLIISLLIIPVCIGNVLFASSDYQDNTYQQALEEEKRLNKVLEDAIKSGNRKKIEEARRMIEKHRRVAEQARREIALKEKLRTERLMHENRMAQMAASKMRAEGGMKESMMGARKELALKETAMMREQMLKERQISERKMVEQKLKASRMTESKMRMKSIKEQTQIRGKTQTLAGAKSGVVGAKTGPLAGGKRLESAAGIKSSLGGAKDILSASDFRSTMKRASVQPSPAVRKVDSRKTPDSLYSAAAAISKGTKDIPPPKAVADIQPSRQTYSAKASTQHRPPVNAAALEARPPGAPKGPNEFSYNDVFKDVPSKPQPQRSSSASPSSGKVKAPSLAEGSGIQQMSSIKGAGKSGSTGVSAAKPLTPKSSWSEINRRSRGEVEVKPRPKFAKNPKLADLADPANKHISPNQGKKFHKPSPRLPEIEKPSRILRKAETGTAPKPDSNIIDNRTSVSGSKTGHAPLEPSKSPPSNVHAGKSSSPNAAKNVGEAVYEAHQKHLESMKKRPVVTPEKIGRKMPKREIMYDPNKPHSQQEITSLRRQAGWQAAQREASSKVRSFKEGVHEEAVVRARIKELDTPDNPFRKESLKRQGEKLHKAIRQQKNALRKIQGDPLAVDEINRGDPNLREKYTNKIEGTKQRTARNLEENLAKRYHADPSEVKAKTYSLEKPKTGEIPKAGHDQDWGATVKGREVPGHVVEKELPSAHGKAVGEKKMTSKDLARKNIHGVSHDSEEGLGAYPGEQANNLGNFPGSRAHDPQGYPQQWGEKVERPAYKGHQLQQEGDMPGAELNRFESQREIRKMGGKTVKRVEAHGGKVSEHVKKSLEIVDQAGKPGADRRLTSPQEIEARLRARGETTSTLRSKLEANNAGVEVLKGPGKQVPDSVRSKEFVKRVERQVDLNRMEAGKQQFDWEKGLKKPSREGLKPGETRTGKKALTKGLSSSSMKSNWQKGKEIAGETLGVTMAAGWLASGYQREVENAAEEGRPLSHLKAFGNVGKDVAQGSVVSPLKTGMKAAREELKKLPEYEKQVRKDLKKDSAFQRMTKEEQDKFVQDIAKTRAAPVAAGKALKGVFYDPIHDSTHGTSKRILEEEALKEFKEANAAGEGNKLSAWRVAKYKARAAARIADKTGEVAWEYSGIGPMVDLMMYDSKAKRQASDMQRRLQKDTKSKLLDGLTKTTRISGEIEQLTANGDPNDPATQQKLQTLREEYAATLNKVRRVDERMKDKVGHSDPMVAKLQGAVREIAENPTPWWADEPGTDTSKGNTSEGEKITDPEPFTGNSPGERKSTPGESKITTGASGSTTDELTKKQPSKASEKQPTEGGDQYVSVSGDELYGGTVSKTTVKVKAELVSGDELYGGPGSKTTVDDVTQKLLAQINDQHPIESGDQRASGEGKPANSGDNIDALRDAGKTHSVDETSITSTNPILASLPNMLGSFINSQNLQSNDESSKFQGDAARSVEESLAAIQARDYQGQKQISTGELNLEHSITQVELAEESAEAIAEAERNQRAEARDAIASTFTRVIATPFDTGGRILGTGTAKHSAGIKPSHTDGSSSHGASGSSSGDNRSGTHGPGGSGNTRSSPFQGTISGGWSGSDMSGSFTMHISAGGAVTGSYSGSSSGSLSGNVGSSGNVRAASGSATGEDSASWTGSIRRDSNGRLSGSGSWDSPFASGGWSGGGS